MSKSQLAGTAEILRASQKDEEYMRYMRKLLADVTQRCLGIPFWMKWKDLSNTFSDAVFFSLTTLSGLQTLGEEYANIIQIDRNLKSIPSKWARLTDVSLRTFGCYFLLKFQTWIENQLSSLPQVESNDDNTNITNLKIYLPIVFKAISVLQRIHLIVFYLYGNYYNFSKRLTGINYLVIRRWLSNPDQQTSYKVLGWIAATQLFLSLAINMYAISTKPSVSVKEKESNSGEVVNSKNQCSLCFEKRSYSTATPCGHLFCWSCITSWMQNKEECPLCRESFPPSKLILLQNYY
ncbi:peroxisome biogenesis factor 10 [Trichonephila inaurata madagascariensis]|uniref:RING-type E3 ubiquitin transferase n=1 Tax=Trichonephila inaurata madagascariensis TaxID=2747483 RepID=A0A8X7CS73_9ARAC|nr:peroxisome biogenesis factor 10 [Trichonephila inaurata madagascariensis]